MNEKAKFENAIKNYQRLSSEQSAESIVPVDFPRRNRLDKNWPEELKIWEAIQAVEGMGAHPLLTEAVVLLSQAKDKVADWIELTDMYYGHTP